MKTENDVLTNSKNSKYLAIIILLGFSWDGPQIAAQDTHFFRISGPAATSITEARPDGTIVWTNAQPGATYIVQIGDSPSENWRDYVRISTTAAVSANRLIVWQPPSGMAFIPAGTFEMGDSFNDASAESGEGPVHSVFISAFYMDKFEVTKARWDDVYSWAITHAYTFTYRGSGKAQDHPVQTVSWHDVVKWCNARSEKEGRVPAYYTSVAQTTPYRTGLLAVRNDWVKWDAGYRLPTEAEWEKAARGGATGHRFSWADADTITHSQANYNSVSASYDISPTRSFHPAFSEGPTPHTSPVGYFSANGYGLYDMSGNVWEWCWDWYGPYSSSAQTDPHGPATGSYRVDRGGGWNSAADGSRSAFRYNGDPADWIWSASIGFRSVLP